MKKCAFCTNPAVSPEHVFSQWMLDLLPPNERYVCNERIVSRDEYVKYQSKKLRIIAKVVCTPCNNGWMSDLENEYVKPVMQPLLFGDEPSSLDSNALATLAKFAFKILVVANHKDLHTTPFYPSSVRSLFRRRLDIPDGVQVWLGRRHAPSGRLHGFWKSAHSETHQQSRYGFKTYVCTWNFQNVVLQILVSKWKDKRRRNAVPAPAFESEQGWHETSILIWPDAVSARWPPPLNLVDDTVQRFADRWNVMTALVLKN